jgi:hypothetical protein
VGLIGSPKKKYTLCTYKRAKKADMRNYSAQALINRAVTLLSVDRILYFEKWLRSDLN